jgi:maltose O-acetyltransferase
MWRIAILKLIPGRLGCAARNLLLPYRNGKCVTVWDHVHIEGARGIVMGDHVSVNRYSILHGAGRIQIGSHVQIGPRVTIYSQNHRFDNPFEPIDGQGYELRPVTICDDVWIAAGATILPGVTIGSHSVVAAGSVVVADVPARSLVAGVPARVVRSLPSVDPQDTG